MLKNEREAREVEYYREHLPRTNGLPQGRVPWIYLPLRCRRCIEAAENKKAGYACACGQDWSPAECRLARGRVIWKKTSRFLLTAKGGPPWPEGCQPPRDWRPFPIASPAASDAVKSKATEADRTPSTFVRPGWI